MRLLDIAEKLGVSSVTVSNALSGKDGVGEELRERILLEAKNSGYRAKAVAASGGSAGTVGIVTPERFFGNSASFYGKMYGALSRELLSRGLYAMIERLSSSAEERLELPRLVSGKKVDAVIFMGQLSSPYARFAAENCARILFLDFYSDGVEVDSVGTDNFYSECLLTKRLISLGHKDIRFVGTFGATTSINDRYMGFCKAMMESSLPVLPAIEDRDKKGRFKRIEIPEKIPDAFVCNCDESAALLIRALKEKGLSVPKDVSVAGFDDFLSSDSVEPALTTVAVDIDALAAAAADLTLKKISGQETGGGRIVLSGRLVFRDSVGKARHH